MPVRLFIPMFIAVAAIIGCARGPSFEERRDAGIAAYQSGDLEEAEQILYEISADNPRDFETRYYLARTFAGAGNFPRALDEWDAVILLRPAFAEAHYRRGNSLVSLHRTKEAIAAWEDASRLNPGYVEAHYNQAKAYEEIEDYNRAVEKFVEAIGADSTFFPAQYGLAYLLERAEQFDIAADRYRSAMRADSTQVIAQMGYIRALRSSGDPSAAVEELDRFIATRNPQPPLSDSLEAMREAMRREAGVR